MSNLSEIIQSVEARGLEVASLTYTALSPSFYSLLQVFGGIAFLYMMYNQATRNEWNIKESIHFIFLVLIGNMFITNEGMFLYWIYEPITDFISQSMGLIIGTDDVSGMANTVEQNFDKVLTISLHIIDDGKWNPVYWIAAIVLIIPYFAMALLLTIYILWAYALILIPYALGPIFIFAAIFKPLRRLFVGAIDMLISSAAIILISSFFMSVASYTAQDLIEQLPSLTGQIDRGETENWLWGPMMIKAIFVGYVSLYWLSKAPTLAGYLTNKVDLSGGLQTLGGMGRGLLRLATPGK